MAAEIGRALVHLSYVISVTILGFVLVTLMWPFISFLIDSGVRNSILASGRKAVVSIFIIGWGTLSQRSDLLTILVGCFVVGEIGTAVSQALFLWPSEISKTVTKFLRRSLPMVTPMPGTTEDAAFRLWLVQYPEKRAYYDWENFLLWIDGGLSLILLGFSFTYLAYYVSIAVLLRPTGFFGSYLSILGFAVVVLSFLLTLLVSYGARLRVAVVTAVVDVLYKEFQEDRQRKEHSTAR